MPSLPTGAAADSNVRKITVHFDENGPAFILPPVVWIVRILWGVWVVSVARGLGLQVFRTAAGRPLALSVQI